MNEPEIIQCTKDHLLKIFRRVKCENTTQSQFDQDKTMRIVALSEAIQSLPENDSSGHRNTLVQLLKAQCESYYQSPDFMVT